MGPRRAPGPRTLVWAGLLAVGWRFTHWLWPLARRACPPPVASGGWKHGTLPVQRSLAGARCNLAGVAAAIVLPDRLVLSHRPAAHCAHLPAPCSRWGVFRRRSYRNPRVPRGGDWGGSRGGRFGGAFRSASPPLRRLALASGWSSMARVLPPRQADPTHCVSTRSHQLVGLQWDVSISVQRIRGKATGPTTYGPTEHEAAPENGTARHGF